MEFENGIGQMSAMELARFAESAVRLHTRETFYPVNEIKAIYLGGCGVPGANLKKMTAHTHEEHEAPNDGVICIETPALAQLNMLPPLHQLNFLSDIIGHETAHVLMGERCRCEHEKVGHISEGHGLNWQMTVKDLGFPRQAEMGCKACLVMSNRHPAKRPLPDILSLAEHLLQYTPRAIRENREEVAQEEVKLHAMMRKAAQQNRGMRPQGVRPPGMTPRRRRTMPPRRPSRF